LPVKDADGQIKLPALDNHGMGTVFEELIRRFNEENNEEAGEHFTPRDVVKLMAKLLFLPVANQIQSGTYLLYDGSCGTGGMLTVAEDALHELAASHDKEVSIHLFGQEINPETYAICKADLLLKGEGEEAENIVGGSDKSTLSADQFRSREFDFMISNPPYGKSWKTDLDRMGGKKEFNDPRFIVSHAGNPEFKLITRSSDGQLMFLVNKLQKMKHNTPLGSRIALVHNGSALFTGDAGQGESNIRRWVLENDWLEAIIALPLNIFYNTGIATYIWVLANKKPAHRCGKVQLIDASQWFLPMRRNLGKKNCELADADIERILKHYLDQPPADAEAAKAVAECKWFDNADFGYWKITVERPLRLKSQLKRSAIESLRFATGDEALRSEIYTKHGDKLYTEFAKLKPEIEAWLKGDDGDEDMDSYRVEAQASLKMSMDDADALIEPPPTGPGGGRGEPDIDKLSNIIRAFNDMFGNIEWKDGDKIRKVITEEIPARVAQDKAYQNAQANSDKQNAKLEHDKALNRVVLELLSDHTELFKQFSDNANFKRWLTDMVFDSTYHPRTASPQPGASI
jgi:type I restriction enzyme M protein